jgi:hypothetical protein
VTVSGVQGLFVDIDCAAGQSFKLSREKTTDDLLIQALAESCVTLFFAFLLVGPPRLDFVRRLFLPRRRMMFAMSRHGWIMPETGRQSTIGSLYADFEDHVFRPTEDCAGKTPIGLQTINRTRVGRGKL